MELDFRNDDLGVDADEIDLGGLRLDVDPYEGGVLNADFFRVAVDRSISIQGQVSEVLTPMQLSVPLSERASKYNTLPATSAVDADEKPETVKAASVDSEILQTLALRPTWPVVEGEDIWRRSYRLESQVKPIAKKFMNIALEYPQYRPAAIEALDALAGQEPRVVIRRYEDLLNKIEPGAWAAPVYKTLATINTAESIKVLRETAGRNGTNAALAIEALDARTDAQLIAYLARKQVSVAARAIERISDNQYNAKQVSEIMFAHGGDLVVPGIMALSKMNYRDSCYEMYIAAIHYPKHAPLIMQELGNKRHHHALEAVSQIAAVYSLPPSPKMDIYQNALANNDKVLPHIIGALASIRDQAPALAPQAQQSIRALGQTLFEPAYLSTQLRNHPAKMDGWAAIATALDNTGEFGDDARMTRQFHAIVDAFDTHAQLSRTAYPGAEPK